MWNRFQSKRTPTPWIQGAENVQKLNIDDIARLAFVSRSVVSRVLNNRPNVSDEARARVLKVIEKYNYRPSATARSLATDRTYEISILAPRKKDDVFANGFWSLIFLGISEECIRRGFFVSLSMISGELETHLNDRILNGHNFDGYILISKEVADKVVPALRKREIPTVLIGRDPDFPDLHSVDVDNVEGGYKATKHLVDLSHRHIAIMTGPLHTQESLDRLEGYKKALEEAGLPFVDALCSEGDYSQEGGHGCMQRLLEQTPRPTAVFCVSDAQAAGALLAIHRAGLTVPGDVSVIGYDDLPISRYTIPPLTSMHQPIYHMGERAADIVIDQIEGKIEDVVHVHLQADLVERETCSPPR